MKLNQRNVLGILVSPRSTLTGLSKPSLRLLVDVPTIYWHVKRERITITFCALEQHVIRAPNEEAVARNWMVIVTTSFTGSYRLFYWDALNFDGSDASLQQGEVRSITVSNPGKFEAEMTAIAVAFGGRRFGPSPYHVDPSTTFAWIPTPYSRRIRTIRSLLASISK